MLPIYREEIKGQVRQFIADFKVTLKGEFGDSEMTGLSHFYFGTDQEIRETEAYAEYSKWLTDAELLKAAKSAMR